MGSIDEVLDVIELTAGALPNIVTPGIFRPVKAEVYDGKLLWLPAGGIGIPEAHPNFLRDFLLLAHDDIPDAAFANYARQYGVLWLCASGFPVKNELCGICSFYGNRTMENPIRCIPSCADPSLKPRELQRGLDLSWFEEPIWLWRLYARLGCAILRLNIVGEPDDQTHEDAALVLYWVSCVDAHLPGMLRQLSGEHELFKKLGTEVAVKVRNVQSEPFRDYLGLDNDYDDLVGRGINAWLMLGRVSLGYRRVFRGDTEPAEQKPAMAIRHAGLFGALGIQILQAATGAAVFAICTVCRRPFFPDRQRTPTRAAYCSDECKKRGATTRGLTSRRRKREAASH